MGYAVHILSLCRKYISPSNYSTIRSFDKRIFEYTKLVFVSDNGISCTSVWTHCSCGQSSECGDN